MLTPTREHLKAAASRAPFAGPHCPLCHAPASPLEGEASHSESCPVTMAQALKELKLLEESHTSGSRVYGDCIEIIRPRVDVCRLCGKTGPHRSGPTDRFHHVVLNADGTWPP